MRAVWASSMHGSLTLHKENLSTLNAFDLCFLLLAILEIEGGKPLELVFLDIGHNAGSIGESTGCKVLFEWLEKSSWETGS